MSFAARGLLTYMLSLPQDWRLNEKHLISQSPLGRDGVRSLIRELEAFGYLLRTPERTERGLTDGWVWNVFERPWTENPSTVAAEPWTEKPSTVEPQLPTEVYPLTENPSMAAEPLTAFPAPVEPAPVEPSPAEPAPDHPTTYKQNSYTNLEEDIEEEPPISPASGGTTTESSSAIVPQSKASKPRDRFASKVLPADVIPDDLLDCQQLLPDWWLVKGRGRSEGGFKIACNLLRRYTQDERRQILETAIMGGHQGLYPPRESRSGTNSQPRPSATSSAFANASALIKRAEGRS